MLTKIEGLAWRWLAWNQIMSKGNEVNHMLDNSTWRHWKTHRCDSKLLSAMWYQEDWSSCKWKSVNGEDEQHQLFTVTIKLGKLPKSVTKLEGGGQSWVCLKGIQKKGEEEQVSYFHLKEWREGLGGKGICKVLAVFLEKLPGENKDADLSLGQVSGEWDRWLS